MAPERIWNGSPSSRKLLPLAEKVWLMMVPTVLITGYYQMMYFEVGRSICN